MEVQKKSQLLQWHPAFYAGIQIELEEEAKKLIFENEYQLSTKPMEIDVLVIKKNGEEPIYKNIGRIFRKYNIVEYKSPTDYLSIDDFYKVYGYTCFYKSNTKETDSIKIEELTITLVCHSYPRKLMKHLKEDRNYSVTKVEEGIYYIQGDKIPIQLILTKKLTEEENLWLRSLTNELTEAETAQKLIREYKNNKNNIFYQSVMNIIVRANMESFGKVKNMCEALQELMKDELEERENKGIKVGMETGMAAGMTAGMVTTCRDFGLSAEDTEKRVVSKFHVTSDEARQIVLKYWDS